MSRTMWVTSSLGAVMLLSLYAGCDREETVDVGLDSLPYLRETHHPQLQAELARLEAEQATPRLLGAAGQGKSGGETMAMCAERLTCELNEIRAVQHVRLALEKIEPLYPRDTFRFDPIDLERFRGIQRRHLPKLNQYRTMFYRDGFRFCISLSDGLLADLSILEHATFVHRLEAFCVADELVRGEPAAAMLPLRTMLMVDKNLAALPCVATRRAAGRLRAESLRAAAALVEHPQCTELLRGELLKVLEGHLQDWTPDRIIMIGDRALGIHAYELVRDGQIMNLLTSREIERLKEAGELEAFCRIVEESVDEDEWFYLSAMRRVIRACDKPFYERIGVLDQINREAEDLMGTHSAPLFAARVLLTDMALIHRELALDRARCEAWVMGLRAAAGKSVERNAVNPVTGRPYELVREQDAMLVKNLAGPRDEEPAVTVPVLFERES